MWYTAGISIWLWLCVTVVKHRPDNCYESHIAWNYSVYVCVCCWQQRKDASRLRLLITCLVIKHTVNPDTVERYKLSLIPTLYRESGLSSLCTAHKWIWAARHEMVSYHNSSSCIRGIFTTRDWPQPSNAKSALWQMVQRQGSAWVIDRASIWHIWGGN